MVDRYTKSVLTVIAVLLAVIVARDIPVVRDAAAELKKSGSVVPVKIVGIPGCKSTATKCEWSPIKVHVVETSAQ